MTEQNVWQFCGAVLKDADICEFDGKILCEHCLTERTTLCDCCLDLWIIWLYLLRKSRQRNHWPDEYAG